MRRTIPPVAVLATAVAWMVTGCSRPAPPPAAPQAAAEGHDHDHGHGGEEHDHPDTLAEGVAQLKKAAADVKTHLAAGKADAADDVVHGVGHLIEDIQGLLPKEKLSDEGRAAAAKALDEVFACFDELDTALHAPAGKGDSPADVHAGVAKRIEDAIKTLESAR